MIRVQVEGRPKLTGRRKTSALVPRARSKLVAYALGRSQHLEFPATALGVHDLLALGLAGHCRDDRIYIAVAFLLAPRKEAAQIVEVA